MSLKLESSREFCYGEPIKEIDLGDGFKLEVRRVWELRRDERWWDAYVEEGPHYECFGYNLFYQNVHLWTWIDYIRQITLKEAGRLPLDPHLLQLSIDNLLPKVRRLIDELKTFQIPKLAEEYHSLLKQKEELEDFLSNKKWRFFRCEECGYESFNYDEFAVYRKVEEGEHVWVYDRCPKCKSKEIKVVEVVSPEDVEKLKEKRNALKRGSRDVREMLYEMVEKIVSKSPDL